MIDLLYSKSNTPPPLRGTAMPREPLPPGTPTTITGKALNGHTLVYNVIGVYADGTLNTSSWDARHSDTCTCATWDVDDWGDLL
jgi:hypothetical protein